MDENNNLENLRLMAFDVDGVLTDGALYFTSQGDEMKAFSSLDGHGMKMLGASGVKLAIITGRQSRAVEQRAKNLGIELVLQGVEDKRTAMAQLLAQQGLSFAQAGYVGDDVVDLQILRACGFSATVANAHPLVKEHVAYVAAAAGGHGGVREICEFILRSQGHWDKLVAAYLA